MQERKRKPKVNRTTFRGYLRENGYTDEQINRDIIPNLSKERLLALRTQYGYNLDQDRNTEGMDEKSIMKVNNILFKLTLTDREKALVRESLGVRADGLLAVKREEHATRMFFFSYLEAKGFSREVIINSLLPKCTDDEFEALQESFGEDLEKKRVRSTVPRKNSLVDNLMYRPNQIIGRLIINRSMIGNQVPKEIELPEKMDSISPDETKKKEKTV